MLDIKLLRKERDRVEALLQRKEPTCTLDEVLKLDTQNRETKTEVERLKALRNAKSKEVGERKRQKESADALMEEVRELGAQIEKLDQTGRELEEAFKKEIAKIPNLPFEEVKDSQDVNDNVILKTVGEKPSFDFAPKNHLELNELHHLFDFEKTAKTCGTGWPAYRGMGARLEWALLSYMIDVQVMNGFELWLPPLLVRPEIMFGSGQIPKFEGQFYQLKERNEEHELYLIPTAEVILNGLHHGEVLTEEELPKKYSAYTPCFRREAGAAGAQERGLIRVHQFNKVEMFCWTHPEKSEAVLQEMIGVSEQIMEGLGLHYRLAHLVTGDMSFTAARTIDLEVFLPGQERYYEVSSFSNCTDYQARRSNTRFRPKGGKPEFVHTLNGSGLATPRLMVALLENYQQKDGSIHLPPVLQEKLGVKSLEA